MATKRTEQEWRELIQDFENYGHQSPAVFYIAHDVHAHELKRKKIELKKHGFIPVTVTDSASSKPIASLRLPFRCLMSHIEIHQQNPTCIVLEVVVNMIKSFYMIITILIIKPLLPTGLRALVVLFTQMLTHALISYTHKKTCIAPYAMRMLDASLKRSSTPAKKQY